MGIRIDDLSGLATPPEQYPNWLESVLRYTGAIKDANAQLQSGAPQNPNLQPTLGPNNPIASAASIPPILPDAPSFQQPAHPSTMRFPMWPTPPAPVVASAPTPPARPVTPTPASAYPVAAAQPSRPVTPTPASAYPPDDPNRWLIERQNAPATQGQPSRGYQTALDLSHLFGGRPNPADVPAANAQPVSGGVLSKNGLSKAPWNVGPQQKGKYFQSEMGPFTEAQRAARGLKQRYE